MGKSIIQVKSFDFGVQIVKTYQSFTDKNKEYVLSKQLLRSGTSIGANVSEAVHGQSNKDFVSKLSIARKEANETLYWINLLNETSYLNGKQSEKLMQDCEELLRILTAIIKTSQSKMETK